MTYDITIKKQGSTIHTVQGVEAITALEAIARVEKELTLQNIQPRDRRSLLEFQARRLDFSLS